MKKTILGSAVVLAVCAFLWARGTIAYAQLDAIQARYARLSDAYAQNLAAIDSLVKERNDAVAALESRNAEALERAEKTATLKADIKHAPESDNGPVAPVLRRALDGLGK